MDKDYNFELNLIWASARGNVEMVRWLIEMGVDIHAEREDALKIASKRGHTEIVKLLIDAGADIHSDNDEALRLALEKGYKDIVNLLLKKYRKE